MPSSTLAVLVALLMLVGLAGVLVPGLPGLLLIAAAVVLWAVLDDSGGGRWVVCAVVLAVLVAGTLAKYAVPSRSLRETGAPRRTMLVGVVCAVVGFFVVPVVGLVVGFVLGVFVAELARVGTAAGAWASTWATLKGIGLGMLLELTAGVLAVATWAGGALALHL
ncbi:DUF456 domain-containing protein [Motilibacter peucedani]|uniref:DUF456 domain-containing protein n=1 Tax=Motilibacter peucedani TaxID=598650 RepID=UPI001E373E7C|nr:DUF456 domain-containing protein [Motilibacter peucedani]